MPSIFLTAGCVSASALQDAIDILTLSCQFEQRHAYAMARYHSICIFRGKVFAGNFKKNTVYHIRCRRFLMPPRTSILAHYYHWSASRSLDKIRLTIKYASRHFENSPPAAHKYSIDIASFRR